IVVCASGYSLFGQAAPIGGRSPQARTALTPTLSSSPSVRPHAHAHAATAAAGAVAAGYTLPENIPDFSTDASRPAVQSVGSGSWSSPSTWHGGQNPNADHVVRILAGSSGTLDDTPAVAYRVAV